MNERALRKMTPSMRIGFYSLYHHTCTEAHRRIRVTSPNSALFRLHLGIYTQSTPYALVVQKFDQPSKISLSASERQVYLPSPPKTKHDIWRGLSI